MAVTKTNYGSAQNKTAATTVTVTTTSTIPANTLLVIGICADNTSATAPTISSITAVGGGTWTDRAGSTTQSGATSTGGTGVFVYCQTLLTTSSVTSGTVITVTFNASPVAKAVALWGLNGATNTLRNTVVSAASTAGTPSAATAGTALVAGDIVIGVIGGENSAVPTGDADTTNGSWSAIDGVASSGGGAATNCAVGMQWKQVTATGTQTYDAVTAADSVAIIFAVQTAPVSLGNTLDGGSDETAISTVNSGGTSGNAFDTIGGTAPVFDTAFAKSGAVSARVQVAASATSSVGWTVFPRPKIYTRCYMYLTAYTSANLRIISVGTPTPLVSTSLIATSGVINFAAGNTAAAVPLNQWVRIEQEIIPGTSQTLRLFLSPESITPTETRSGTLVTATPVSSVDWGICLAPASAQGPIWFDDLAISETDWIGPSTVAVNQASYRFYADGTETGSTALAAQDTAYTADVSAGDANLLLRTRLQSASAVDLASTDDWQVQWEKNASGVWSPVSTANEALAADYDESNASQATTIITAAPVLTGEAFLGDGRALVGASFWLTKQSAPTGTLTAYLYSYTGTYGSGSGADPLLATSTTTIAASTLPTNPSATWARFTFDGTFALTAGTPYVIAIGIDSTAGGSTQYHIDTSSPTWPGNAANRNTGSTWATNAFDLIFRVHTTPSAVVAYNSANLTDGAATTNRLGAGTNSFVAGEVSETGLVTDLGWAGNNYTELLYALTLKQAGLANSDTLRFRVLRNAATTGMTYTQTPTIPITLTTGTTWTAAAALTVTATQAAAVDATHEATAPLAVTSTQVAAALTTHEASATLGVTATGVSAAAAVHEALAVQSSTASLVAAGTVVEAIWAIQGTLAVTATQAAAVTATHEALAASPVTAALAAAATVTTAAVTQAATAASSVTATLAAAATVTHEATGTAATTAALAATSTGTHEALAPSTTTAGRAAVVDATHAGLAPSSVTATLAAAALVVGAAPAMSTVPRQFTNADWIPSSGDVTVSAATFDINASSANPSMLTNTNYDLTGDSLSFQLPAVTSGTGVQLSINLKDNASAANQLRFVLNNVTLTSRYIVASASTTLDTRAWDPANSFLRFRHSAGTVFWDTSADGKNWTNITSVATPITLNNLEVNFQTSAPGTSGSGSYTVAHLNSGFLSAAATLAPSAGLFAAAAATHEISSALTVTAGLTAAASVDHAASAALVVTEASTAADTATHEGLGILAVTEAGVAAATVVEAVWTIAGTLSVTETGVAAASATHEALAVSTSTAALVAAATVTEAVWEITGTLPVAATALSAATVTHEATASLAVTATSVALAGRSLEAAAPLALTAGSTASALTTHEASAASTATALTQTSASATHEALAPLLVTSTRLASASTDHAATSQPLVVTATGAAVAASVQAVSAALALTATGATATAVDRPVSGTAPILATLSATGAGTRAATAATAAVATLVAAAAGDRPATGSLATVAASTAAVSVTHAATASLIVLASGSGDIQGVAASKEVNGTAALTATSLVAAAKTAPATAALTATSTGAAVGSRDVSAAGSLPVVAASTSASSVTHEASAALAVTVSTAGVVDRAAGASASLGVTATLATATSRDVSAAAALTATALTNAASQYTAAATAALPGVAVLNSATSAVHAAVGSLTVTTLTASVTDRVGVQEAVGAATVHATLVATASLVQATSGSLTVTATTVAVSVRQRDATGSVAVVATLSASATVTRSASADLPVTVTSVAVAVESAGAEATLNVAAVLVAAATLIRFVSPDAPSDLDVTIADRHVDVIARWPGGHRVDVPVGPRSVSV